MFRIDFASRKFKAFRSGVLSSVCRRLRPQWAADRIREKRSNPKEARPAGTLVALEFAARYSDYLRNSTQMKRIGTTKVVESPSKSRIVRNSPAVLRKISGFRRFASFCCAEFA